VDQAKAELAAARPDELDPVERGWRPFLEGMLADASGEPCAPQRFYQQAAASAVNRPSARALPPRRGAGAPAVGR
jgi:hypothetical protein